jgi:cation transport regulator
MPYKTVSELPDRVKDNIPRHAQEIYMKAYNNAWDQYKDPDERRGDDTREETAHTVAWAAVKNEYEKDDKSGRWKKKQD